MFRTLGWVFRNRVKRKIEQLKELNKLLINRVRIDIVLNNRAVVSNVIFTDIDNDALFYYDGKQLGRIGHYIKDISDIKIIATETIETIDFRLKTLESLITKCRKDHNLSYELFSKKGKDGTDWIYSVDETVRMYSLDGYKEDQPWVTLVGIDKNGKRDERRLETVFIKAVDELDEDYTLFEKTNENKQKEAAILNGKIASVRANYLRAFGNTVEADSVKVVVFKEGDRVGDVGILVASYDKWRYEHDESLNKFVFSDAEVILFRQDGAPRSVVKCLSSTFDQC